jgi:glutamate 5-kinase
MRIVAKIGTASITDGHGVINRDAIAKLCDEVAALRADGHDVLVVSSGAVAAGVAAVGLDARPNDMPTLQAISAAGQSRLVETYNTELARHGLVGAQLLLDSLDFVGRRQYLHARQTLLRLLELGCVPVVNENDAIANEELRFGDNDRIAALVANSVRADVLVLLTDMDGLHTADPRRDETATLISNVGVDDPLLAIATDPGGSGRGSGGMASKLIAARMASWSGVRSVIARASSPGVLPMAVAGDGVGTTFEAHDRPLPARKLWIAFAADVNGAVVVDAGAEEALTRRPTSLLPAGVVGVSGSFLAGDVIDVVGPSGVPFARGIVSWDAQGVQQAKGRRTSELPAGVDEVIHRDDLIVLP